MTYPDGVTTRPVSFGPALRLEDGTALDMEVQVTASRTIVWQGAPMVAGGTTYLTTDQVERTIDLPVTDQDGYTDGAGQAISVADGAQTHSYEFRVVFLLPGSDRPRARRVGSVRVVAGVFLPTGDGSTVDLDDLVLVEGNDGALHPVLDSWRAEMIGYRDAAAASAAVAEEAAQIAIVRSVPAGGTTGQVLGKATVTDYDMAWFDPDAASRIGLVSSINGVTPDDEGALTLSKTNLGLGSVDNTTDATKNVAHAVSADTATSAGSATSADVAGKLTTARAINGVPFDGTGDIAIVDSTKEPVIAPGAGDQYWRGDKTWATLDKTAVGLGNVDDTTDADKPISSATQAALDLKADLVDGVVPAAQLPSYVDDVLEFDNLAAFPGAGEAGKIYVAKDTNLTYRWSGSTYGKLDPSLALGETSSTAYRGDRGKTAYDHSQTTGNPHGTTPADIGAATATQGAKADTAVQPGALAAVATTGAYADLTGKPTIPSSASDVGAVPTSRKVNGKTLTSDITLSPSDVGAASSTGGGREAVAALAVVGSTATGDCSAASVFTVAPSAAVTLAFTNVPASGTACSLRVVVTSGATAYVITAPSGTIKGTMPTTSANKVTMVDLMTLDGGSTWYITGITL